jgi:hypothetical protein
MSSCYLSLDRPSILVADFRNHAFSLSAYDGKMHCRDLGNLHSLIHSKWTLSQSSTFPQVMYRSKHVVNHFEIYFLEYVVEMSLQSAQMNKVTVVIRRAGVSEPPCMRINALTSRNAQNVVFIFLTPIRAAFICRAKFWSYL